MMAEHGKAGGADSHPASDPTAAYVNGSPAEQLVSVLDQYLAEKAVCPTQANDVPLHG